MYGVRGRYLDVIDYNDTSQFDAYLCGPMFVMAVGDGCDPSVEMAN